MTRAQLHLLAAVVHDLDGIGEEIAALAREEDSSSTKRGSTVTVMPRVSALYIAKMRLRGRGAGRDATSALGRGTWRPKSRQSRRRLSGNRPVSRRRDCAERIAERFACRGRRGAAPAAVGRHRLSRHCCRRAVVRVVASAQNRWAALALILAVLLDAGARVIVRLVKARTGVSADFQGVASPLLMLAGPCGSAACSSQADHG